jgi:ESS family glutamate:Na+ symporter
MVGPTVQGILFAAVLLAMGLALRANVRVLRVLYIPAAVVAGLVGLLLIQAAGFGGTGIKATAATLAAEWKSWPGFLIAVVFAGMLLDAPPPGGLRGAIQRGARSGILAWIIILGQIAIGLAVYLIALKPGRSTVPATFGQLLEVSWAGGHGTAAAMGDLYAKSGFAEGGDIAFFLATVGLVYGVLSGLVFVNIALRRGWTATAAWEIDADDLSPSEKPHGTTHNELIEPLAVQVVVLAMAFGIGVLLQQLFVWISGKLFGWTSPAAAADAMAAVRNVPLFLFTLLGGGVLRRGLDAVGLGRLIDQAVIARLMGVAMEFLIVAGVASMQINTLGQFGWPIIWLLVGAAAWSAVCLLVLSRRLLPRSHWFELGLLNYGFSTANTPQGMMLLRIVDPQLKSGAATDYAMAAPLSAPFIGGGVVTFLLLPWLLAKVGALAVLVALVVIVGGLIVLGRSLNGRTDRE